MTNDLHSYLNSLGVVLSLLGLLWLLAVKMTKLEVKVDTMWGMLLKRAIVEGVSLGVMEVHSPVRLINHSADMLDAMAQELRDCYQKRWSKLGEKELALAIESEFGTRLVKDVCIPNQISFGVCIIIAVAVAKNIDSLAEILDENLNEK